MRNQKWIYEEKDSYESQPCVDKSCGIKRCIWEITLGFLMLFLITALCSFGTMRKQNQGISGMIEEKTEEERPLGDLLSAFGNDSKANAGGSTGTDFIANIEEDTGDNTTENSDTQLEKNKKYCVVLDAGHGADDPGKIGCNDAEEKDINLAIVKKLKQFLEAADVQVVLTRDSDAPLYESSASSKKMSDMRARIATIEKTKPDLVVSIHQNSYHESDIYGPQVFYYKASAQGKLAAEILQASFDGIEEIENRRVAKSNDNYYLLLHTSVPMVIAECGFLSNPTEAQLLVQENYQEKISWVLHLGILQYLSCSKE